MLSHSRSSGHNPPNIPGIALSNVGARLHLALTADTSNRTLAGYHVLYDIGVGLGFDQLSHVVQTVFLT
ncbi:hypothetical protein N7495_001401 [Penicillium taxi]|uniref:uncharacterized protein n=1 Tax=Penicillium taxi TaxID=168475 RepID=UPI0025455F4E|nr:uncharacterized protein N7495_001401 [Penicillium taxi]KAJ5908719.1 hypothetical protein N7495_001401 [Penicillium taxi]